METIERETKLRLTPERIEDFLESQRVHDRLLEKEPCMIGWTQDG